MRRLQLPALLAVSLAVAVGVQPASGASNTTPATRAGRAVYAIGPNTLKPPECASLTLTSLVTTATGTNAADLQLGTANADSLNGGAGSDCIIGGGGNDTINGGGGTNICIGGPGTDTFTNCATTYP